VETLTAHWRSSLDTGRTVDAQARMRRFDARYRWFPFHANPLRDESGTIGKWYGTNTDIEDWKRADDELRQTNHYLKEAQRLSQTGSFTYNIIAGAGYWSEDLFRVFEFELADKILPDKFMPRFHPEDRALAQQSMQLPPGGS
jgi:hypothetical protein